MEVISKAADAITRAKALLLGISNGLSMAEGYNIFADNEMFRRQFGQFQAQYGINCVLDGIFYQYPTEEDRADFFRTLIQDWITDYRPGQVMRDLLKIVDGKDYFIITSNGDMHLERPGFDPDKIFEIEGTFITSAEKAPIVDKSGQLREFVHKYAQNNLVFLEVGIGSRNRLIKAPLMDLALNLANSTYIIFNLPREIYAPEKLWPRAIALPGDLAATLELLSVQIGHNQSSGSSSLNTHNY